MTTPPLSRRLDTTSYGSSMISGGGTKRKGLSERQQQQSSSSSPPDNNNNNNTKRQKSNMMFSQSLLVESLQASLEHERSMRTIDRDRFEQKILQLEKQIEFVSQQATQEAANATKIQARSEALVHQMEQSRNAALQKLRQCQMDNMEYQSSCDSTSNIQFQLQRVQNELNIQKQKELNYQQTIEQLQHEIESISESVKEKVSKRQEEEEEEASPSPSQPTAATTTAASSSDQTRQELTKTRIQLADTERQVRQYERKNQQLEQRNSQLQEEIQQANLAKSRYDTLQQQYRKLQSNYETANAINKSWKLFGQTLKNHKLFMNNSNISKDDTADAGASSDGQLLLQEGPPEVSTVVRHLQQLKSDSTKLQNSLNTSEQECHRLRTILSSTQDEIVELRNTTNQLRIERDNLQSQNQTAQDQITTLKASEAIADREKQSLRDLIHTYDEQQQQQQQQGSVGTISSTATTATDTTTQTLQLNLKSTQEQLSLMKTDRDRLSQQYEECQVTCHQQREEIGTIKSKFALLKLALQKERDNVRQANDRAVQAETLAGKGQYNPNQTQVLHLRETPLAHLLKDEIKVLQRQLEVARSTSSASSSGAPAPPGVAVAAGGGSATKGGGGGTPAGAAAAMAVVAAAGADPGKLNKRLKENFKEQIALFREGVYLMTGYKVDMLPSSTPGERPTFRVRSVFAENESDHLILKWPQTQTAVSSLDVLDTQFAKQLTHTPSYGYMSKFRSLPAFLASVQLSLFEKQTVMM